jgi:hypothetical protein
MGMVRTAHFFAEMLISQERKFIEKQYINLALTD